MLMVFINQLTTWGLGGPILYGRYVYFQGHTPTTKGKPKLHQGIRDVFTLFIKHCNGKSPIYTCFSQQTQVPFSLAILQLAMCYQKGKYHSTPRDPYCNRTYPFIQFLLVGG